MRFVSPEGRGEVLWVESQDNGAWRVINVPVWIYGISLGSLVSGKTGLDGFFEYDKFIEPAPGGTVRCIVPKGGLASRVYLERIVVDATKLGMGIGPSTFLDPRMVAIHLHVKDSWTVFGKYLDGLVTEGVLQEWEVGDPDEHAEEYDPTPVPWNGRVLVHQEPNTYIAHHFTL